MLGRGRRRGTFSLPRIEQETGAAIVLNEKLPSDYKEQVMTSSNHPLLKFLATLPQVRPSPAFKRGAEAVEGRPS